MNKLFALLAAATLALCASIPSDAQVPPGLMRFGTTGAYSPQVGNCLEILAMNSSGQTATDSGTPCNPAYLTAAYTNATTAYTAIMTLPTVAASTTNVGECHLTWEGSSTSLTPTFAVGLSSTPTDLWVTGTAAGSAYAAPTFTTIANTTTTAVTGALTTTAANTPYKVTLSFVLQASATAANVLTVYAESNNASYTVTVEPGSFCGYIP